MAVNKTTDSPAVVRLVEEATRCSDRAQEAMDRDDHFGFIAYATRAAELLQAARALQELANA